MKKQPTTKRKTYKKDWVIYCEECIKMGGFCGKCLKDMSKPTTKKKCRWCGKSKGVIKFYIIADDLEKPKAYHPACIRLLHIEVWKKLSDVKSQIN